MRDKRQVVKKLRGAMTVREIAETLRISTQAVYYHLHKLDKEAGDGATEVERKQ